MKSQDLKRLVEQYSAAQIEDCIQQQIEKGANACTIVDQQDEVIAALSRAEVVREMMDQGMTFAEALRELGKKIRKIYGEH